MENVKYREMGFRRGRRIRLGWNIYAVQQDTQSVLMIEFYSSRLLARHVSDLTSPSSGAFYKLYLQIWYVVLLCVLLNTSSRYFVTVGRVK